MSRNSHPSSFEFVWLFLGAITDLYVFSFCRDLTSYSRALANLGRVESIPRALFQCRPGLKDGKVGGS